MAFNRFEVQHRERSRRTLIFVLLALFRDSLRFTRGYNKEAGREERTSTVGGYRSETNELPAPFSLPHSRRKVLRERSTRRICGSRVRMTRSSGYDAFNAADRSRSIREITRRVTSSLFLDCCTVVPCYPRGERRTREESSNERILAKDEQLEMKRMASNDSLTRNEIPANVDADCSLIRECSCAESREPGKSASTITAASSEDRICASSVSLFGVKRVVNSLPMLSRTSRRNDCSESDGEYSLSDVFPIKKSNEQKSSILHSELFPKCRVRRTSQQRSCDNSSEDGTSQFRPISFFFFFND